MPPPDNRLRALDSIPTADQDADFTRSKEEAERKFASRMEQIFEKYETMPDSRSDVLDLHTGTVVIDNGHLREQLRDPRQMEAAKFLGDFLNGKGHYDEDSEDELAESAPSTCIKPRTRKSDLTMKAPTQDQGTVQPTRGDNQDIFQPDVTPADRAPMAPPLAINPTTLLDAVAQQESPLVDAVRQQYGGDILQHLSQVFVNLLPQALSSIMQLNTPTRAPPLFPTRTPATGPTLPPPTDPKWFYPAFEDIAPHSSPAQSLFPTVAPATRPRLPPATDPKWFYPEYEDVAPQSSPAQHRVTELTVSDPVLTPVSSPPRKRRRINLSRGHGGQGESRPSSTTRPRTSAQFLQDHEGDSSQARTHVSDTDEDNLGHEAGPRKVQSHHAAGPASSSTSEYPRHQSRSSRLLSSQSRKRQLPTPQSLVHSESSDCQKESYGETRGYSNWIAPPPDFSEEDMELLSLTGDETPETASSVEAEDTVTEDIPSAETVLPSVESDNPMDDYTEERTIPYPRMIVQVRIPRPRHNPQFVPVEQTPAPKSHTPAQMTPKSKAIDPIYDSDFDLDLVPTDEPLQSAKEMTAVDKSQFDLEDELEAPVTPYIKREPLSPRPSSFLTMPLLSTPKSAPHSSTTHSSATKSTPRPSKSQIARMARAQWAKQRRCGTPKTVRPMKSMPVLKRHWIEDESEDELSFL